MTKSSSDCHLEYFGPLFPLVSSSSNLQWQRVQPWKLSWLHHPAQAAKARILPGNVAGNHDLDLFRAQDMSNSYSSSTHDTCDNKAFSFRSLLYDSYRFKSCFINREEFGAEEDVQWKTENAQYSPVGFHHQVPRTNIALAEAELPEKQPSRWTTATEDVGEREWYLQRSRKICKSEHKDVKKIGGAKRHRISSKDFVLPQGWITWKQVRENGKSAGSKDSHYMELSTRKRFRSRVEVKAYLHHKQHKVLLPTSHP